MFLPNMQPWARHCAVSETHLRLLRAGITVLGLCVLLHIMVGCFVNPPLTIDFYFFSPDLLKVDPRQIELGMFCFVFGGQGWARRGGDHGKREARYSPFHSTPTVCLGSGERGMPVPVDPSHAASPQDLASLPALAAVASG